jgi:hypothetical protein
LTFDRLDTCEDWGEIYFDLKSVEKDFGFLEVEI